MEDLFGFWVGRRNCCQNPFIVNAAGTPPVSTSALGSGVLLLERRAGLVEVASQATLRQGRGDFKDYPRSMGNLYFLYLEFVPQKHRAGTARTMPARARRVKRDA